MLILAPALVIGGALLCRQLAQQAIEDRLREEASQREVELSWDTLSLGFDLTLEVTGLRAARGEAITISIERIGVSWRLEDLFHGERRPERLDIAGLATTLDVEALKDALASKSETATDGRGKKPLATRLEPLFGTTLKLDGASIDVKGLPEPLGRVKATDLSFFGEPDNQEGWRGVIVALCDRGCGDEAQRVDGTLLWDIVGLTLSASLEKAVTYEVPLPGRGDFEVSFEGAEAHLPRFGGRPTASVRRIAFPFDQKGYEGRAQIDSIKVEIPAFGLPDRVSLHKPIIHARRHTNPNPRQKPYSEDRPWRKPEKRLHEASTRGRILAALPRPEKVLKLRDKAIPWLRRVAIEDGELHLATEGLSLTGLSIRHEGEVTRVGLSEGEGELAASLVKGSDTIELHLDEVPADRAAEWLGRDTWSLGGAFSGDIKVRLGGGALGGARPTYIQDKDLEGGFHVKGKLDMREGLLYIPGLSPGPIDGQRARINFNASYRPPIAEGESDRVVVRKLIVALPSRRHEDKWAKIRVEADIEHLLDGDEADITARVWMKKTRCAVAFGAIPEGMLPNLHDHIKAKGSFAPDLDFIVNLKNPYGLHMELEGLPGTCRLKSLGKYSPAYLKHDFKQEVREGVSRAGIMIGPESGSYVRLNLIPSHVRALTYMTEEGGFYKSSGFSLSLIKRAVRLNLDRKRYAYGGSTLSQQLVKNLFMTRHKTLSRKLEEAFIVWKMEEILTKDRILELYLNSIEYGPDLYGIRRAARFYFGKMPSQLTPIEGAFLAALKPSPLVGMNFMGAGHTPISGWWYDRLEGLVRGMARRGMMSKAQLEASEPFIVFFRTFGGSRKKFREDAMRKRAEMLGEAPREGGQKPAVGVKPAKNKRKTPFPRGAKRMRLRDLPRP